MTENRRVGRVLAIDFGTKRLGVAVSDEAGIVGMPLATVDRVGRRADVALVAEIVKEKDVDHVVVGLPLNLDGTPGTYADDARRFGTALESACEVGVTYWDERLTTAEAERLLIGFDVSRRKRRKVIDKLAATLILQSYLDARASREEFP